jgi:hypothetical protein
VNADWLYVCIPVSGLGAFSTRLLHGACGSLTNRACCEVVGHPVGLAQPDHAATQGQPSRKPVLAWAALLPLGCRAVALRRGRAGCPTPRPPSISRSGPCARSHPGCLPARRGHSVIRVTSRLASQTLGTANRHGPARQADQPTAEGQISRRCRTTAASSAESG